MEQQVSYSQIHAYMLEKTRQYYQNPPAVLVDAVLEQQRRRGRELSRSEAKKLVSLIDIQRYIRQEMTKKWPEFMSRIPENPLPEDR